MELRAGSWQPGPYTYFDIHEPKLRWVVHDRKLLAPKQFEFSAVALNECGRMVGGWLKTRQ